MFKTTLAAFLWNKAARTLTAEASDLGPGPLPSRIAVVNEKTGVEVIFNASRTIRDEREDETLVWVYNSVNLDRPIEVHLLND